MLMLSCKGKGVFSDCDVCITNGMGSILDLVWDVSSVRKGVRGKFLSRILYHGIKLFHLKLHLT